jgi:predicted acetyltransferase
VDVEIRTIQEREFEAYLGAVELAFSGALRPEEVERERTLIEYDRAFAAFDGPEIVGTTAAFTMPITVPGGEVSVPYVTCVGVRATHRRRGINTALMRSQLDEVHERGEPLAVLTASEGGIYGRFGYGLGTYGLSFDMPVGHADFVRGYHPAGTMRFVSRDDAISSILGVHEAVRHERPGMPALNETRLVYGLHDHEHDPDKGASTLFAVHEGENGIDGFVIYRVKHEWSASIPESSLTVRDLQAANPAAYADLWRFVLDVDLIARVTASGRPVDDPLLHLIAEPRRLRATLADELWVRVVDVAHALRRRCYAAEGRVVLEVHDRFCPWNDGRYALEGGPDGATCETTDDTADLVCSANDVGVVYLGGTSFRQLQRAGLVEERTAGALARADAMFTWDPAPWSPYVF